MVWIVIALLLFWLWVIYFRNNDKEASGSFITILTIMIVVTVIVGVYILFTEGIPSDPNYDMPIGK